MSQINEEQLRANRFELVSQLADDLAHEIKNPLNSIVINIEVLRARLARGDAEAASDRADVIESEVRRLHNLVDRMLQLLRPERDAGGSLPLDQVLDELIPLVAAQTRLARNELLVEGNAAVFVRVRRDVLKFALLNVFTAVHGRLGEGGGTLVIDCRASGQSVRVVVRTDPAPAPDASPAGVPDAVRIAGSLLGTVAGTVDLTDGVVTVVLPRSGPL